MATVSVSILYFNDSNGMPNLHCNIIAGIICLQLQCATSMIILATLLGIAFKLCPFCKM